MPSSPDQDLVDHLLSLPPQPVEYHLGEGVLNYLRNAHAPGDAERHARMLESGLEFRLVHPFHEQLFDARVRAGAIAAIAAYLAERSPKEYAAIQGTLSSDFNEDRFMGPRSLCRYQFHFAIEMLDGPDHDSLAGRVDYQDDTGTLVLRNCSLERHELSAEFVLFECSVCDYSSSVYFLRSESASSRADFPCPVCSHRASSGGSIEDHRRDFARGIETVPFAELVREPASYHLRKVRTSGRLLFGQEDYGPFDPRYMTQFRILPTLLPEASAALTRRGDDAAREQDTRVEGFFKYAKACSISNASSVETLEPDRHSSTRELVRSHHFGFGHGGICHAEFLITGICD